MTTPITVTIPHQLGRAEARRRIESGFAQMLTSIPGGARASSERWEGDRLDFSLVAMGQTVAGIVDVRDAAVAIEIALPGVLGVVARALQDRLRKAGSLLLTKE
jgi:hypothetical protein